MGCGYREERVLSICEALLVAETLLGCLLGQGDLILMRQPWGHLLGPPIFPSSLTHMGDHPMSGSLVNLDMLSKLGCSNVGLGTVVVVKPGSNALWCSFYQGAGSLSLLVDSGQVVDQWSMAEGLEKAMCLLLGLFTMFIFQPLLGRPFLPYCEKHNPHGEATCGCSGLSFSQPSPSA